MIEFKTNYTPGPWEVDHSFEPPRIYAENDTHIADVFDGHNANLKAQSVKMAEYMMKNARKISSDLKCDMFLLSPYDTRISVLNNELDEILSILKDAGIEVVEK